MTFKNILQYFEEAIRFIFLWPLLLYILLTFSKTERTKIRENNDLKNRNVPIGT